jgi:hypothetical protein
MGGVDLPGRRALPKFSRSVADFSQEATRIGRAVAHRPPYCDPNSIKFFSSAQSWHPARDLGGRSRS